jgi:glutamine synthetase
MTTDIHQFFRERGISEVEAIIPDMAGIARGKIMPAQKFAADEGMKLPESIFLQTVTGDYPLDTSAAMSPAEIDIVLKPDTKTVREVPWAAEPTAQVIHDCFYSDGRRVTMAPRHVLRHVLELYAQRGWEPVVAPELEFYLIEPNIDADYPLKPPIGRSGRAEPGRQSLQHRGGQRIRSAVRRHLPVLRASGHRDRHADPRGWACADGDQPAAWQSAGARRPGVPVQAHGARGRAATQDVHHVHGEAARRRSRAAPCTSTRASSTRRRAGTSSANPDGTPSQLFFSHIAGLQKYLPAAMALFAPNVNSLSPHHAFRQLAPINVQWGYDNRTAGLRVPVSDPENRRVENRVGAPTRIRISPSPASLACGYLGMIEGLRRPTRSPAARTTCRSRCRARSTGAAPAARKRGADRHPGRAVRVRLHDRQGPPSTKCSCR